MIWVSREVANLIGLSYSFISLDMYILSNRSISDVWQIFSIGEGVACWFIVDKAPIFINTGLCCSIQYGTSYTHYVGVVFVFLERVFDFISDRFYLQYLLWWGLTTHESRIWEVIPFIGRDSHDDTAWCIFNIYPFFLLHQVDCSQVFIASFFWMILHPLLILSVYITHCYPHSVLFLYNNCSWCVQGTFIVPSFPTLREPKLISGTLGLRLPIIIIDRLLV